MTKTSRSHIGLLVHDVFNASIPSDLAGTFFSYDETQRLWVEYGTGKQLEEGSVLRFKVHALENANDMMAIVGSLQTAGEKLGLVGQRPKPSIPHAPELAPLYEASPSKMAKQFVDELKRKREEEGEGGDDDERDTLFEGNATLKKKRKQDKGSAAETAGAIEAPGEAADGTPGSPPAPKPKDKHRDPSTLSARDLKKLQRKKDRKKEKAAE